MSYETRRRQAREKSGKEPTWLERLEALLAEEPAR